MSFKKVDTDNFTFNPFSSFIKQNALLTVEKDGKVNTMTIGWGNLGIVWQKKVVTVYVRPQRYTKEFIDNSDRFSVSFLPPGNEAALKLLGTKSGRDGDKIKEAGLSVEFIDNVPVIKEAETVITAHKLFASEITEDQFSDKSVVDKTYPKKDFHTIYIGEVTSILKNEQ